MSDNTTSILVQPLYPPRPVQFSILLTLTIFAIPCFIFIFYHLLTSRILTKAIQMHVIFLLLINSFLQTITDVPMSLSYHITGVIQPATLIYCYIYNFVDYYFFLVTYLLLAWASIERYIYTFNYQFFHSLKRRILYHYFPLIFFCLYPFAYYVGFMFFYPCVNYYDYNIGNCAVCCFLRSSNIMAMYEQIVHGFALVFLIYIGNILLIVRIFLQKHRIRVQRFWKKSRKMTLQIASICCASFFTGIGFYTIQLIQLVWDPNFGMNAAGWINPFSMLLPPLIPFICLYSLPNLKQKFQSLIYPCRPHRVTPLTTSH